jgi:hypothetical protein
MMIEQTKQAFLQVVRVASLDKAMSNSLIAALQHNRTYRTDTPSTNREAFRSAFAQKIRVSADPYRHGVVEQHHLETIEQISDDLSRQFGHILVGGRLRIGTTQKALNLYLKFMWCLDPNWATPTALPN